MKRFRNKDCKECPQKKREDVVWQKGYQDGFEAALRYVEVIIDKKLDRQISEKDEDYNRRSMCSDDLDFG